MEKVCHDILMIVSKSPCGNAIRLPSTPLHLSLPSVSTEPLELIGIVEWLERKLIKKRQRENKVKLEVEELKKLSILRNEAYSHLVAENNLGLLKDRLNQGQILQQIVFPEFSSESGLQKEETTAIREHLDLRDQKVKELLTLDEKLISLEQMLMEKQIESASKERRLVAIRFEFNHLFDSRFE